MKRFFDRPDTHWRRGDGALHLYATPGTGSTVAGVAKAAEPILNGMGALVAQPLRYVHITLQRLDLYEDELDDNGTTALRTSLAAFARTASPLTVRCGSPLVRREAVEVLGEDRDAFNALVSGSRAACAQAGLADALTEPPFGPHFTLAYCTTASDEETDRQLAAALSKACPASIFTIDRISLVSVEQRRDEGIFAFDTLAEWELGVN